jgi:hypothetical protein
MQDQGSRTQLLLQKGENASTVLHALLHQLQEAYGVTRVVTTVSEVVLQTSRGGRPQVCRDGRIQLECNIGVKRWSVGREPNSWTAWTRRSRIWRCGWAPSMGPGRVLPSGRVGYGSGNEYFESVYLLSRLMRGHPGLAALCHNRTRRVSGPWDCRGEKLGALADARFSLAFETAARWPGVIGSRYPHVYNRRGD